jgi:hypothetical protein
MCVLYAVARRLDIAFLGLEAAHFHKLAEEGVMLLDHRASRTANIGNNPAFVASTLGLESSNFIHRAATGEAVDSQSENAVAFDHTTNICTEERSLTSETSLVQLTRADLLRLPQTHGLLDDTATWTLELKPHPPSVAIPSTSIDTPHCKPVASLGDAEFVAAVGMWETSHEPVASGENRRTSISSSAMDCLGAGTTLRADPEQLVTSFGGGYPWLASHGCTELAAEKLGTSAHHELHAIALSTPHTDAKVAVSAWEPTLPGCLCKYTPATSPASCLIQFSTTDTPRLSHMGTVDERNKDSAEGETEI